MVSSPNGDQYIFPNGIGINVYQSNCHTWKTRKKYEMVLVGSFNCTPGSGNSRGCLFAVGVLVGSFFKWE